MRVPQFFKRMAASVLDTLAGIITKPRVVREAEFLVDLSISLALAVIPGKTGWVACIVFFLFRDVAYLKSQSPGKVLYKLKIVNAATGATIGWRTSIIRNLILLTPLLNIADVARFVKTGRRLTDEWLGVEVVQEESTEGNTVTHNVEDNPNPPTTD